MAHPDSRFTHAMCVACWRKDVPDHDPITANDREVETCCFCGCRTASGIYVRADPTETPHCTYPGGVSDAS